MKQNCRYYTVNLIEFKIELALPYVEYIYEENFTRSSKNFHNMLRSRKKIMLAKKTRNVFEIKKKVQNARCSVHTWKLSSGDCQVSASNCKLVSRNKLRRYPDFALWRLFPRAWALVPAFVYLMKCIVSVSDAFPNSHTKLGGFGGVTTKLGGIGGWVHGGDKFYEGVVYET